MTSTINASTSAGVITTADTSGILQLQTAGTAAVTVDTSQNVGIGTASPASKLDVSGGSLRINEDGAGTKIITMRSNYASLGPAINVTTNDPLLFLTNNTERMRIDSSGNLLVGVATTIASKYTATVSTSATTISSFSSDYGQMVIVSGNSGGNIFSDLLFSCTTAGPTVLSSKTISGAPVARTYTMSAQTLRLAMASGTYEVWCAQYVGK